MNLHWGPVNIFEGIRIILSIVDIVLALFSAVNVNQGELIIPRVRRSAIRMRRRMQMYGFFLIALVLGLQSVYVATIEEPDVLTTSVITGNIVIIIALTVLFFLTAIHIIGWSYEGHIVRTPLLPDSGEKLETAVAVGRTIRHTANNALMTLSGPLELVIEDPTVPEYLKLQAKHSLTAIDLLIKQLEILGEQLKELSPNSKSEF